MPSLRLEDHVLRIAEHQSLLFDYLGEKTDKWNWGVDLAEGTLTFADAATGRALLTCPTFLLGSQSHDDNSFLWGWANPSVTQLPAVSARWDTVRAQAASEGAGAFTVDQAFGLEDESESLELAVTAAGALNCFTFFAGGHPGGTAFLAVASAPEVAARPADVLRKITIIGSQISLIGFDHRAAILAYLGQPNETTDDKLTFNVQGAPLAIVFDGQNRIADMQFTASPENVAPPPSEPKRGLFKRLFGG